MRKKIELEYTTIMELYKATGELYSNITEYAELINTVLKSKASGDNSKSILRLRNEQIIKALDILKHYQRELIKLYIIKPRFGFLKDWYLDRLDESQYTKILQLVALFQGGLLDIEVKLRQRIINDILTYGYTTIEQWLSLNDKDLNELEHRLRQYIAEGTQRRIEEEIEDSKRKAISSAVTNGIGGRI